MFGLAMAAKDTDRRVQTVSERAFRFQALIKPDGEILEIDRQALSFWGLSQADIKGRRFWEIGWRLMHDEQATRLRAAVEAVARGQVVRREAAVWDTSRRPTALTFSLRPIRDASGRVVVLRADAINLARRAHAEGERIIGGEPTSESRAHAALMALPVPILLADAAGRIEFVSAVAAAALGRDADALIGEPLETILGPLGDLPERCQREPPGKSLTASFTPPGDSSTARLRASCAAIRGAGGGLLVVLQPPVGTAAEQARDGLTGLLNRGGLLAQLERLSAGPDDVHALCYLDLDDFEQFDRRYGRDQADQLLRQLAAELRGHARHGDLVARLDGDDFALLLHDCALSDAHSVADALLHTVRDLTIDGEEVATPRISASIGIAPSGGDAHSWLSDARAACLEAKEAGGNRVVAYVQGGGRNRAEEAIRRLFGQGRVRLFQQPVVELGDGARPAHAEILLRVMGDDGVPHAPAAILHRAAHTDLLASIDRWVIGTVFAHRAAGDDGMTVPSAGMSINLTAASIGDPDLVPFIKEQRDAHGLDPARVSFELPESAALADPPTARALMATLRDEGFAVALDDCGSSLSMLRNLPVDYLKIGGSLIGAVIDDPVDHVLVDSINRVAHLAGTRTVAKWVENDATVKRLRALQVDYAQGFGLAEPMPLWEVSPNAA